MMCPSSSWATPTGEITRAVLSPDEVTANLAGSATWNGCEPPPLEEPVWPVIELYWDTSDCGWIPFATVGPGESSDDCADSDRRRPEDLGSGVVLVWSGSESQTPGVQSFDLTEASVAGATGQLLCLSRLEIELWECDLIDAGGWYDGHCSGGVEHLYVLAAAKIEGPDDSGTPDGSEAASDFGAVSFSPGVPPEKTRSTGRNCHGRVASRTPRGCKKGHRRHKSFSRREDISVPRR